MSEAEEQTELEAMTARAEKAERELRATTNRAANLSLGRAHAVQKTDLASRIVGDLTVHNEVLRDAVTTLVNALRNEHDRHADVSDEPGYWDELDMAIRRGRDALISTVTIP